MSWTPMAVHVLVYQARTVRYSGVVHRDFILLCRSRLMIYNFQVALFNSLPPSDTICILFETLILIKVKKETSSTDL